MSDTKYLTAVVGRRGVGKTTLLAHFATQFMIPPQSVEDLRKCNNKIKELRSGGRTNLSLPLSVEHLVYVVDDVFTATGLGYAPRNSMELRFDKLGLWDGEHDVSRLPPYSKIFIPEIQNKLDSRNWQDTPPRFLRLLEYQRKWRIQMWVDLQIHDSADKRLRSFIDCLIEVQGQKHTRAQNGKIVKTVWKCLEFENVEAYERFKNNGKKSEAIKTTYTHHGCIYDCLNSFNGEEWFLYDMKGNFDTKVATLVGNDKDAQDKKCEENPLFKKKEKAK
jgi:hypothetical protein